MFVCLCAGCRKTDGMMALTVCTSMDEDMAFTYLAEFKKYHPDIGVQLMFIDETGIEEVLRLPESERPDVVWGCSAVELTKMAADGLLLPHASVNIKALKPEFMDTVNSPPMWIGMSVYVNCFVLSEYRVFKDPMPVPCRYDDLLSQALKNGIVIPDPLKTGTGFMFVSAILQKYGEEKGWEYLTRLDENVMYYTDEPSSPVKEVGRGNCLVGISYLARAENELKKNAPIIITVPEGTGWDIEANALVKKSSIHPMARVFLDWAVSDIMMKIYARHSLMVGLIGIEGKKDNRYVVDGHQASSTMFVPNELKWAANQKGKIMKEWQKRFGWKCRNESRSFHPKKASFKGDASQAD